MFKRPTTTDFRVLLTGTLPCLILAPLLAPADPPARDTGGTDDATVFTEPDSVLQRTAGADYSFRATGYILDDQQLLDLESSLPEEFPDISVAAAYSRVSEIRGGSLDELQAVSVKKIRVRQKVVDWVKARSPAAGVVTHLLVAKPDNGWHLAIDPGDEVMLEWKVTF